MFEKVKVKISIEFLPLRSNKFSTIIAVKLLRINNTFAI